MAAPVAQTTLDGMRVWEGTGVRVSEVARRLNELRALAGEDLHSTLTSVMNLVVWASTAAEAVEIESVIDGLRDHHPSRAVIVIPGDGGDGLDARVEVMSHPDRPGGRTLQVEQIVLTVRGAVAAHASSAVIPLLRSDLPTFLWWPGAAGSALTPFLDLVRIADRLITETGRRLRGAAALDAIRLTMATSSAPVTDLAWAVVTPWRQMVATSLRDDTRRAALQDETLVTVTYSGDEPSLEALLLAGWLSDALGAPATASLASGSGDEDVVGVRVTVANRTELDIARDPSGHTATVTTPDGGARCVPLTPPDRRQLIAGELEHRGVDQPLTRAVERACREFVGSDRPLADRRSVARSTTWSTAVAGSSANVM